MGVSESVSEEVESVEGCDAGQSSQVVWCSCR